MQSYSEGILRSRDGQGLIPGWKTYPYPGIDFRTFIPILFYPASFYPYPSLSLLRHPFLSRIIPFYPFYFPKLKFYWEIK